MPKFNITALRIALCALGSWFFAVHAFLLDDSVINTTPEWGALSICAVVFSVSMCCIVEDSK